MGRPGHEGGKGATRALGSWRLGGSTRKGQGAVKTRVWMVPTPTPGPPLWLRSTSGSFPHPPTSHPPQGPPLLGGP